MELAELKELCASKADEARDLRKKARAIIDEVGEKISRELFNKRVHISDDPKDGYTPASARGQDVFCRGFSKAQTRMEISVEVSPYRIDGRIGNRILVVPIRAVEKIVK